MGIGYAAIAIKAGFTPLQTISMSFLVYAGAGQIIAASMALTGATAIAIILTNFVVNLRYFVMSTCVLNKVRESNTPLNIPWLMLQLTNPLQCFRYLKTPQSGYIWELLLQHG